MFKRLFLIISLCFCMMFSLSVSADNTEPPTELPTESITQAIVEPTDIAQPDDDDSIHMIIYCFGFLSGCLLAQAFSFWKW